MADRLYIGHPGDMPHADRGDGFTRCGWSMDRMKEITDKQAHVYLDDRRCNVCYPFWETHRAAERLKEARRG